MTYRHTISGRQFTVTGEGPHGAKSRAGFWDDGTPGVIWPEDNWGQDLLWSAV